MEEKRLVPKRRFKGYYNKWLELRLKDFRDESDRYSYTGGPFGSDLKSTDYTETGIRIIQLQNIGDGFFSNSYKIYTSKEKAESLSSNLIFPDDIIIAKMAEPLARAAIIPNYENKYLMASDGIRLKVDKSKFNNYFILTLINHDNFRIKALENSTGTTRKRIGLVTLGDLCSYVPEFGEQQKIGEFFKALDKRIANQERKIAKVKALKSAYLTEMFPQEGEIVPKRRFEGFDGEWIEVCLKNIGKSTSGTSIESEFIKGGKYKVISIGSYSQKSTYTDQGIRVNLTTRTKERILNKDDLTMILNDKTSNGNILGRVLLINESDTYVYNQRTQRIEPNQDKYDAQFLYQMLNAPGIRSKIVKNSQGNTQIYINWTFVEEIIYLIPSKEEQQKIGQFFKNLDDQIATEEKKLEKLKKMKEAYLEEMFV